ncbi:nucleoside diphosphate-linked moiety X motif 17-like [Haliotis cracherodii]|uniref:nucleoside diphosphate-linked moiety X motif 17-like n=1 Tax=Haliotis cracherodii TaxID=6455 RepID=UPI0039E77E1C
MTANTKRILVHLKKTKPEEGQAVLARFSQCILEYFGTTDLATHLHAEMDNNRLVVTDDLTGKTPIKLKHPPFCPVLHLTPEDVAALPPETANRGVDVGAAVVMETGDGKVLLTRRAKHLRAFPGIWVPPGGHIEENETFVEAGLREFGEETGLQLQASQCVGNKLHLLALWESVYPPKLSHGLPKRHHMVVYLYGKLISDLTSDKLTSQLKMQPEEVDACTWLDRDVISGIVKLSDEESPEQQNTSGSLPQTVRATVLNDEGKQVDLDLPLAPLLQTSGDKECLGRVSTGTKFALEEWLKRTCD